MRWCHSGFPCSFSLLHSIACTIPCLLWSCIYSVLSCFSFSCKLFSGGYISHCSCSIFQILDIIWACTFIILVHFGLETFCFLIWVFLPYRICFPDSCINIQSALCIHIFLSFQYFQLLLSDFCRLMQTDISFACDWLHLPKHFLQFCIFNFNYYPICDN